MNLSERRKRIASRTSFNIIQIVRPNAFHSVNVVKEKAKWFDFWHEFHDFLDLSTNDMTFWKASFGNCDSFFFNFQNKNKKHTEKMIASDITIYRCFLNPIMNVNISCSFNSFVLMSCLVQLTVETDILQKIITFHQRQESSLFLWTLFIAIANELHSNCVCFFLFFSVVPHSFGWNCAGSTLWKLQQQHFLHFTQTNHIHVQD